MNTSVRYWPVDAEGHPIGPPIDAPGLALVGHDRDLRVDIDADGHLVVTAKAPGPEAPKLRYCRAAR